MTTIAVGTPLTEREQYRNLPVGAVVRTDSGVDWTKRDGGIYISGGGSRRRDTYFSLSGINTVASLPNPPVADPLWPPVGTRINDTETLMRCPVGTRFLSTHDAYFSVGGTAEEKTLIRENNGRVHPLNTTRTDGFLTVTSLPTPTGDNDETITAETLGTSRETLTRFMQRFQTVTFGSQQRSGVSRTPLTNAMRKLRVPTIANSPGMVTSTYDERLWRGFPAYTVFKGADSPVVHGVNPSGMVTRLVGSGNWQGLQTVEVMPGIERQAWMLEEWDSSHDEAIHEFKGKAWELGLKAKAENSWCSEYESAMSMLGIDARTVAEAFRPALSAAEVSALPEGSIVRYEENGIRSALYRRDNSADNPARTVRIGGVLSGGWVSEGATCVFENVEGADASAMRVIVLSHSEMESMPTGTEMIDTGENPWVKQSDGTWRQRNYDYGYRPRDFGLGTLRYTGFGR